MKSADESLSTHSDVFQGVASEAPKPVTSEFNFNESLDEALRSAVHSHRQTGDSVEVNTEALLFGLSQVELTGHILREAATGETWQGFLKATESRLSGDRPMVPHEEIRKLRFSSSVQEILNRASERAGKVAVDPPGVLSEIVKVHPEILKKYGIEVEIITKRLESANATPRAFADTETSEDRLDRRIYARALAGLIGIPSTATPLTIGVHGPWGQGKSSFMNLIEKELVSLKASKTGLLPFYAVHFNAWAYDEKDKVWAGLISEIHRVYQQNTRLTVRLLHHLYQRGLNSVWFLLGLALLMIACVVFVLFLVKQKESGVSESQTASEISMDDEKWLTVLGSLIGVGTGLSLAWRFGGDVLLPLGAQLRLYLRRDSYSDKLGFQQEVLEKFRATLNVLLGSPHSRGAERTCRLVIFIDDLDRCSPESTVQVLEALRIFLNENGVLTVLGLDERFVSLAIAHRYAHLVGQDGDLEARLTFGRSYLEKMIQLPVYIQDPTSHELLPFALEMVQTKSDESGIQPGMSIPTEKAGGGKLSNQQRPEQAANELPLSHMDKTSLKALELDQEIHKALNDLREALPTNPRRLKRVLNIYRLIHYLMVRSGRSFDSKVTLAWLLLRQRRDGIVAVIDRLLIRSMEPPEKLLATLIGLPAPEATLKYLGKEVPVGLLEGIYDVPVGRLTYLAKHTAWFCAPGGPR